MIIPDLPGSCQLPTDWKSRKPAEVIPDLLGIKGVGPYTANLAVNLTYGRGGTAHVDTYVDPRDRDAVPRQPERQPRAGRAVHRPLMGWLGEAVLDLLTTDTEVWVTELGATVDVRPCART